MDPKKFSQALGEVDLSYVDQVLSREKKPPAHKRLRLGVLIAAVLAVLTMFGIFAHPSLSTLQYRWRDVPSQDPIQAVRYALDGQLQKKYTLSLEILGLSTDQEETRRMGETLLGSSEAQSRGWDQAYLEEHLVAVRAVYEVRYDSTLTSLESGCVQQYFYLTRNTQTNRWSLWDTSDPEIMPEDWLDQESGWQDTTGQDPVVLVRRTLLGRADQDYTLSLDIQILRLDLMERDRKIQDLLDSGEAQAQGWSEAYLQEHLAVVRATYEARYDNTQTFLESGLMEQCFYLLQDPDTSLWSLWDTGAPKQPGETGIYYTWLEIPSTDPLQVVQSALEGELLQEYTISMEVLELYVDQEETARWVNNLCGSDLAQKKGWTDEYLQEHFVAVYARYDARYDNTKIFFESGHQDRHIYLTRDPATGLWSIWDSSSPSPVQEEAG